MNVMLTLRRRVLALISLALLASIATGLVLSYWHAHKKVAVEMSAAISSARLYVADAVEPLSKASEPSRQIQRIISAFDGNRHLHATWIGPTGLAVAESALAQPDQPTPVWFYTLFAGKIQTADVALPRRVSDLGYIRLSTDSHSEVGEVWEDLSLKMMIVIVFTASVLGLVNFGLSQALRPLTNLSHAFHRVGSGDYSARVPTKGPQEFSRLYASFNAMAKRLMDVETQNQRLNEQLAKVQDEERADIARDLHDEFGPFLFSIDVDARSIQNRCREEPAIGAGLAADAIRASIAHLQRHLRSILGRLRPSALLDLGLKHALEHLVEFWKARQPGIRLELDIPLTSFGASLDNVCFRFVQEALNNAMKHANPKCIQIRVMPQEGFISLCVIDDGQGMSETPRHGFGLSGMRDRISAAGGSLRYGNLPQGGGFKVEAHLPSSQTQQSSGAADLINCTPQVQVNEASHH